MNKKLFIEYYQYIGAIRRKGKMTTLIQREIVLYFLDLTVHSIRTAQIDSRKPIHLTELKIYDISDA